MIPRLASSAAVILALTALANTRGAQYHVSVRGNDANPGSRGFPFRTIQRAAEAAQPGDTITVRAGTYRERVNPPRGGTSDRQRIVYQAAPRAHVEIKGSEVVKGWDQVQEGVWKVTLPNSFFGSFNPYTNAIAGDWFNGRDREHHTGAVYLDGDWLIEAAKLDEVLLPVGQHPKWLPAGEERLWFAQVDDSQTTIWAQFGSANPNERLVEINARKTVFYPDQPGRNFITVRGFHLRHAATPWAPPTAEQVGLIGTHWSKGWTIENNVVSHSVCSGIALGKHGDAFDNTSANSAEGYVKTIERAQAHPLAWTRENIGHHVVRHNTISHCEQAGIVGSLGAAFSTVEDNVIHDIHVRCLFTGAEMAGIKFHAAIDSLIRDNRIFRTHRGLWLDWMAQGTRVSGNLFYDNTSEDLFVEVNHGPFVVDNNLFLSRTSLLDMSQGGAYAHNYFAGKLTNRPEPDRETPYHPPHSTTVSGLARIKAGDDRFYGNVFLGIGDAAVEARRSNLREIRWISSHGLWGYDGREFPLQASGNAYYRQAYPYVAEPRARIRPDYDPGLRIVEAGDRVFLHLTQDDEMRQVSTTLVTTELLNTTQIARLPYLNPDGSRVVIDKDYFGKRRDKSRPTPGPFENPGRGEVALRVW